MVTDLTDQDFEEKVLKAEKPAFVDFYAVWCGPCKMAEPVVEELSQNYKDKILFFKVDVDKCPNIAAKFGVQSIPTTAVFDKGEMKGSQVGFSGKQGFEDLIKKVLQN